MTWQGVAGVLAGVVLLQRTRQRTSNCECDGQVAEAGESDPSTGPGSRLPHMEEHQGCSYLDVNATSPIWPEVSAEMQPFVSSHFGNPSSDHAYGWPCKQALELARSRMASLLECDESCVMFTSCGTESDNTAIYSALMTARARGKSAPYHVVASCIEHPAIQKLLEGLEARGEVEVSWVGVDEQGLLSVTDVIGQLRGDTCLVTIMHSNNEVGSLQPISEIAQHCSQHRIPMHTDAAQSVGKVPVTLSTLGPVDMITIVGHKFGAPKGVAALYVRDGFDLVPLMVGGGQETGRRAGTENVLLLSGLGKAAEVVKNELPQIAEHMTAMRERLLAGLKRGLPEGSLRVNGPQNPSQRLPNTLSVCVRGVVGRELLQDLRLLVAASAAAACHSGPNKGTSSVLAAMKVPPEWADGTLRLSVGRHTTPQEVDAAVKHIVTAVNKRLSK